MDKLFIDTNVYESKGFNFDEKNILIKVLIDNVKNGKYEYCNLSVIDSEIKLHINNRCKENHLRLNRHFKWIKKYIDDKFIYDNCYKDLLDYERFKKNINAFECNISVINSECILKKYFSIELPFENNKDKRKEFPDAFIAEYLNNLAKKNLYYKIHFISNDNGLKQSLDKKIETYTTIEDFLTKINGVVPEKYSYIKEIIEENLPEISSEFLSRLNIECTFIEDEEIEIDSIILNNKFDIEILDTDENKIYINCIFNKISLLGSFSCLDYENSYWPNDEDYYVYTEYLRANNIDFEHFEMNLTLNKNNDDYQLEYDNIYSIELNYEKIKQFANDSFSSFDDNYEGNI